MPAIDQCLLSYVSGQFPGLKHRFDFSDRFTPGILYALVEDTLFSLEECEIFSISEEMEQELSLNDALRDLPVQDRRVAPIVTKIVIDGYRSGK
jgi:hypothetical protein